MTVDTERNTMLRLTLMATALTFFAGATDADEKPQETTISVTLGTLKLTIPESWKTSATKNRMRLATYEIPAADGKDEKGELAISTFPGGGGPVKDNLKRWVGQFEADGRESKLTQGKAGDNDYYIADISGTYNKPIGPPIRGQKKPTPGSRMLAVILVQDDATYFLKLTGEDETVKAQAAAFRASFGGDADEEEEYAL